MGNELDQDLGSAIRTSTPGRVTGPSAAAHAPVLAARAVADGRPSALDAAAVAHLQAIAGNGGVARLLEDDAPDQVRSVLSRSGEALEPAVAADMSARLGADLSGVRIHRDAMASASARAVNANAYTVGSDIVFQAGQYDPASPAGQRTLAHELTHVVQQRAGAVEGTEVGGGLALSHPSDRFEREASSAADQLMAGASPAATPTPLTAARHADPDDDATAQRDIATEDVADDEEQPEEEEQTAAGLIGQRDADEPEEEEEAASA
jgi:hypothetical protein